MHLTCYVSSLFGKSKVGKYFQIGATIVFKLLKIPIQNNFATDIIYIYNRKTSLLSCAFFYFNISNVILDIII